ncbi:M81 family metallopeptidase [Microbacterium sp. SLBN-146]|uniref:M81 family metallopeptidase n=1 Tax=Microbacterium sp. SLBN-146 TaxID=2768457 RepID=UPI001172ABBA|nr:M81 family metallopeptidase [Microbacterium sp. SLBN-146]TQJ29910.1 microcystin degradation protein MlrC [Microbacterium sp. SLBN-146]
MRIAVGGIHQEGAGFSAHRSGDDFFDWREGERVLQAYPSIPALGADIEWVPLIVAMGGAGGPVTAEFFDRFLDATRNRLDEIGKVDGVYLDMHGALLVEGRVDADAEYVRLLRDAVGDDVPISLSMDPHGNLSRDLVEAIDLAACHRHAPHIDNALTRERALAGLVDLVRTGRRPHRAWIPIPVLFGGEMTSTTVSPGAEVFGRVTEVMDRYGVIDAGIWVGFAWADEPRNRAAVLATGYDAEAVAACARDVARGYWEARADFGVVAPHSGDWDEAIGFIVGGAARPVYVSDSGDNQTAGAGSDSPYALSRTIDRPELTGTRILFAGFFEPRALERAVRAGEGSVIRAAVGGVLSGEQPIVRDWLVDELVPGRSGEGEIVAALLRCGDVTVAAQKYRYRFVVASSDTATPLYGTRGAAYFDTSEFDVVVVKNGYLFPTQAQAAASWFMALTPGATDLLYDERLTYRHLTRPLYPFDADATTDLRPTVFHGRGSIDV